MVANKGCFGVPPNYKGSEKKFAESVKENVDILCGHRGDPLDRAITARDLLDSGIANLKSGVTIFSGSSSNLTLGGASTAILDNIQRPSNLTATGAFENILLTWTMPRYEGHAFFQVFRHTSDDISSATLIAQIAGYTKIYSDPVGENQTYYYWVRAVNRDNLTGPFNSSSGTQGVTQQDVAYLLSELAGSITSSELHTDLSTPIATIPTLDGSIDDLIDFTGYTDAYSAGSLLTRLASTESVASGAASSASSLSTSVSSLNTAVSNLQTSVGDLTAGTTSVYVQDNAPTGSIATYSRWYDSNDDMHPYVRIDANGDGTETWESLEDPRIGANESDITDLNAEVFNADGTLKLATSSALSTLDATVTSINGTVTSHATSITALDGAVFDANDNVKLATTSALNTLTSDVEAIYDANDATSLVRVLQSDVTELNSEVFAENGDSLLATVSSVSGLSQTVTNQGNTLSTATSDISALETEVFAQDGTSRLATASALSGLTSDVVAIYDVDNPSNTSVVQAVQADVTSLEGEVFNPNGTSRLATATALSGLTSEVEAIYDGESPSLIKTIQSDVTTLESEVFNANGSSRLATSSAVSSLTDDVEAIYNGDEASLVKSLQTDVNDLNSEVFAANGDSLLATSSALNSLTNDVEAIYDGNNASLIKTIQTDITNLDGEVFNANGTSRLATGSALSALTNSVEAIYDGNNDSIIKTIQGDVTSLEGAMFNVDGTVKLASANAVSTLETEVWGNGVTPSGGTASRIDSLNSTITNPNSGLTAVNNAINTLNTSVYGGETPSASSSRIDALESEIFDANNQLKLATASAVSALETEVYGNNSASASRIDQLNSVIYSGGELALATASAFDTLNTAVTGNGGLAERVDNIATQMFVDSDVDGDLNLATAEDLNTVTTEVFPNGTSNASRLSQLSTAIWSGGEPTGDNLLASADFVSNINVAVFGDEENQSASGNKIDALQVVVEGEDGESGIKSAIETTQSIVGNGNTGLTSQYSVKLDNNGYVSGFGLSNTLNNATPTSAFIVRADKFAIVNPAQENNNVNNISNNSTRLVPFTVQANDELDGAGNVVVPKGVYMDGAFIKNGTITTAQIKNATIDTASITGNLSANRIQGGSIDTSLLNIDGSTLTSDPDTGALKVGSISISSADIADGSITNAKIGGAIQSDDFVAANADAGVDGVGWKIDKGGSAEFSDATFRGSLDAATGSLGSINVDEDGHIKSGQTDFDDGTGFFLGNEGGTPKLSIGRDNGPRITWDGSNLILTDSTPIYTKGNNPLAVSTTNVGFANQSYSSSSYYQNWFKAKAITVAFNGSVTVKVDCARSHFGYGDVEFGIGLDSSYPNKATRELTSSGQTSRLTINKLNVEEGDEIQCWVRHIGNQAHIMGTVTSFGIYVSQTPPQAAMVTYDAASENT